VHILRRGAEEVVDAGPASKHDIAAAVWDAVQSAL
jgi:phosphopantothenoylcysteine decarboxylase/phosphopantothenate--cysteine ligase